jgi:hypothetical protein
MSASLKRCRGNICVVMTNIKEAVGDVIRVIPYISKQRVVEELRVTYHNVLQKSTFFEFYYNSWNFEALKI